MPHCYPEIFRDKVMNFLKKGGSALQASATFGICHDTVYQWKRRLKGTGSLAPKPRKARGGYKHNHETIKDFLLEHPNWMLKEVAAHFNIYPEAVRRVCLKFKITRKKRLYPTKKQIPLNKQPLEKRSKESILKN